MGLKLMVLDKNLNTGETNVNDDWELIMEKLCEEFMEVHAAISNKDDLNLSEELMDLIQVTIRGLVLLQKDGMNIEEIFNRHNKKLIDRGWVERNIINITIK